MNDFYVYLYRDPRKDNEPIYVGKGHGDRAYLWKHKANPILQNKFKKFDPIIEIFKDNLTESEAFDLECDLIQEIGRYDLGNGPLCNLTNGGEGVAGIIQTEEHRRKNGLANMGTYEERYGKETAKRLRKIRSKQMIGNQNGKNISEEGRKKISATHKGKPKGNTHLQNKPNRYIITTPTGSTCFADGQTGLEEMSLALGQPRHFLKSVLWGKVKNTRGYSVVKKDKVL